jgi:hypothetical protein
LHPQNAFARCEKGSYVIFAVATGWLWANMA